MRKLQLEKSKKGYYFFSIKNTNERPHDGGTREPGSGPCPNCGDPTLLGVCLTCQ